MTWKPLVPHRFDCDHTPCKNRFSSYLGDDYLAIDQARKNGWTVLKDQVLCPLHAPDRDPDDDVI